MISYSWPMSWEHCGETRMEGLDILGFVEHGDHNGQHRLRIRRIRHRRRLRSGLKIQKGFRAGADGGCQRLAELKRGNRVCYRNDMRAVTDRRQPMRFAFSAFGAMRLGQEVPCIHAMLLLGSETIVRFYRAYAGCLATHGARHRRRSRNAALQPGSVTITQTAGFAQRYEKRGTPGIT